MRARVHVLAIVVALVVTCGRPSAEIIDRILAVVDNQIITLSDVRAALTFVLVPEDISVDPLAAVLQRLVDRRLILTEVDRYAPPDPAAAAVDEAFSAVERRFKDPVAFDMALKQSAMSRDELRAYVRDSLRIETYLQQRFSTVIQPNEDDLVRYYREHSAEFTVAGGLRPLDDVREAARAGAMRLQREALVRQWLEGLRRRGSVQVLYLGK